MNRTQDFFDKAAEIEREIIDLAYEIPADVRSNELIESCEESKDKLHYRIPLFSE